MPKENEEKERDHENSKIRRVLRLTKKSRAGKRRKGINIEEIEI